MLYCGDCGHKLVKKIPAMDNRVRDVCTHCDAIFYANPKVIVGVLPTWQGQVLLCKRAIEPRMGFWTLPAGFLENGESTLEGAIRETYEEAGAQLTPPLFYRLFDIPWINQVYLFYRAELSSAEYHKGEESLDVNLFKQQDIPWENLAFPIMKQILQEYFEDSSAGVFQIRTGLPSERLSSIK